MVGSHFTAGSLANPLFSSVSATLGGIVSFLICDEMNLSATFLSFRFARLGKSFQFGLKIRNLIKCCIKKKNN